MELTERQREICRVIEEWLGTYGYPPTVREIGERVGLSSPASVQNQLGVLEEKGYIRRQGAKRRALELIRSPLGDEPDPGALGQSTRLPLLGRVAAGRPILAEENIEEQVEVPSAFVRSKHCFVLRVQGQSMVKAGILDGDLVVVRQQDDANNGDIVVAFVDGEVTLKRFYREEHTVRLQPENDAMEPIFTRAPRIVGKVSGVMRSL